MAYEEILTVNSAIQSKRTTKSVADSSTTVYKDGEIIVVRDGSMPYDTTIRVGDGTTQLKNLKEVGTKYSNATTGAAGLMSAADKTKLDGIATGANKTVVDSALSSTSTNPVQNKIIYNNLQGKVDKSLNGVSTALNLLLTENDTPHDSDYFVIQTAGGNEDSEDVDNAMMRKPVSALWAYTEEKLHPRILNSLDYGTTLPSSPVEGQLFFQETTVTSLLNLMYPVGSIYLSVNSASPQTLFGGTWVQLEDRFLLGAGSAYTAGATGGEATHKLTVSEMPSHIHDWKGYSGLASVNDSAANKFPINGNSSWKAQSFYSTAKGPQSAGGDTAHNNMPPYLVVYMWKRTA